MSLSSGPLHIRTRAELRGFLGGTLGGKRHAWGHLGLRHNSLSVTQPCPLCDHGVAQPAEGPALFWDDSPLCATCAAEVAPELARYLLALQRLIMRAGGDWRALPPAT